MTSRREFVVTALAGAGALAGLPSCSSESSADSYETVADRTWRHGKVAVGDNPNPAVHIMSLLHDIPISESGLTFGMCWLGMGSHGDAFTHVDALNHVGYKGKLYNGKPVSTLTSRGSARIGAYGAFDDQPGNSSLTSASAALRHETEAEDAGWC